MARKARFTGKVFKPMRFGEGLQTGTVEWKQMQNRERLEQRKVERAWNLREATQEREPTLPENPVSHPLIYPWRVLAHRIGLKFKKTARA